MTDSEARVSLSVANRAPMFRRLAEHDGSSITLEGGERLVSSFVGTFVRCCVPVDTLHVIETPVRV